MTEGAVVLYAFRSSVLHNLTDVQRSFLLRTTEFSSNFELFRRFRKISKAPTSFVMSVRLSAWTNSAPTERILMKLDI